jgi:hypothetical protein
MIEFKIQKKILLKINHKKIHLKDFFKKNSQLLKIPFTIEFLTQYIIASHKIKKFYNPKDKMKNNLKIQIKNLILMKIL